MRGTISILIFKDRNIWVYLPPSYGILKLPYSTVYVQDGQDLFDPDQCESLLVLEEMFAREELEELILVGIEPKQRNDEYTPWPAPALVERFSDFGGKGADYLSFIVNELKPFIDTNYHTRIGAKHTGIIGASLGGLISCYAAYLHPTVFGSIGSLSGSYWYEGVSEYIQREKLPNTKLRIYMYVGSAEGTTKTNIQKLMVSNTHWVFQQLLQNGCAPENAYMAIEEGAVHEWRYFIKRFPEALKWMFPIA